MFFYRSDRIVALVIVMVLVTFLTILIVGLARENSLDSACVHHGYDTHITRNHVTYCMSYPDPETRNRILVPQRDIFILDWQADLKGG